jgi:hypothetical protein
MPIFSVGEIEALLEKLRESQQTQTEALSENKHLERCCASELPGKVTSVAISKMFRLSTACSRGTRRHGRLY